MTMNPSLRADISPAVRVKPVSVPCHRSEHDITYITREQTSTETELRPGGSTLERRARNSTSSLRFGWRFWALFGAGTVAILVWQVDRLRSLIEMLLVAIKNLQAS